MSRQPDAHESYAVAAGKLHWLAAILALCLLAVVLGIYALARPALDEGSRTARPVPPSPRLQPAPVAELDAALAQQRARLHGYAWQDRQHTTARIPIERAMALLAGAPAAPARPASAEPRR